jgi:hypothetical protein
LVRERGGLLLRVGFVAVLGGGLMLWSHLRKPRDCALELDLTRALPGELVEVDLLVRRSGKLLLRSDQRYGAGAPATVKVTVHAAPGEAEVEATLVAAGGAARRIEDRVALSADAPARLIAR